jgi:hypothetical protein
MEIVGLLWWDTINDIHCAEFYIAKHLRTYTEISGSMVTDGYYSGVNAELVTVMAWR